MPSLLSSVYVEELDRIGKRPIGFYYYLLVLDAGWTSIGRESPVEVFDWGSVTPSNFKIKVKDFTEPIVDMGDQSRNVYCHIGESNASDESIYQTTK